MGSLYCARPKILFVDSSLLTYDESHDATRTIIRRIGEEGVTGGDWKHAVKVAVIDGVSLAGATLGPDNGANKNLYGKDLTAEEIIQKGAVKPPASAQELLSVLEAKSPKNDFTGK